jgi:hypothetical protein
VIPPNDNENKPLWRYVELMEKTGKGQGGNVRFRCRLCGNIMHGSYSSVKAHLLKVGSNGVAPCPKVTIDVLSQLHDEMARAAAVAERNLPKDIPLPAEGASRGKRRAVSAIESSFNSDTRSNLDALIARMFYTAG